MIKRFGALQNYIGWIPALGLGILPIFFLPTTQDYYATNKWSLVVILALVQLVAWAVILLKKSAHGISVNVSPTALAFAGLTLASVISLLVVSPNKIAALTSVWGPVSFGALALILLAADKTFKSRLQPVWFGASGILGLAAVYQFFNLGRFMFPSVEFLQDPLWTPAGSSIAALSVFALTAPLVLSQLVQSFKQKQEHISAFLTILLIVLGAGITVTLWQIIPLLSKTTLPLPAGWAILWSVGKAGLQFALAGVGADNFLLAATAGRPAWLNATPVWDIRFTTNASFLLHMGSVNGLLGIFGVFGLIASVLWRMRRDWATAARVIAVFFLILVPSSFLMLAAVAFVVLLATPEQTKHITISSKIVRIILTILLLGISGAALYSFVRFYAGEYNFQQSLRALAKNDGTATYNWQVAAVAANPYEARYRITLSQTELALANALMETPEGTDQEQNDQNRELVAALIQQAIREAKIADSLAPTNVLAWENIGRIYQSLTDVTTGADLWTVGAYEQAVKLDPTNPTTYILLAAMLVKLARYDDAINQINTALRLKPDFANGYYNLANALALKGDTVSAIAALEKTLTLVPAGSPDATKVQNQLDNLKKGKLPAR